MASSASRRPTALAYACIAILFACQVSAQVFNCVGGSVYIVAHPDDDLLFQSPDLLTDYGAANCITTLFLTSGDAGIGSTYAQSRESGNEAGAAVMAGVADAWTEFNATFGGQPVLVRTLTAAPNIQKVWFRLPDGDVDGTGYSATGYETLRELWFGSISSITTQPGTATFTLATLSQAISQILSARQPSFLRTLDYLSQYDAGDHSDHLTTGRIVQGLAGTYAANATFTGYMGYPVQNLAPTLQVNTTAFNAKSAAFFAYTPYDSGECQSYAACLSAGRGEAYWLARQYVVTPALAEIDTTGAAQSPVTLPSSTNVALAASVVASSASSGQPATAAIDNVISGYPGNSSAEWSSSGGKIGTWIQLSWLCPQNITAIALYDRPNPSDNVKSGVLAFSNTSSVFVGALYNDGSATLITLPAPILTSFVNFTVTNVSATTGNIGLSEFQVYGVSTCAPLVPIVLSTVDLALNSTATASSYATGQPPSAAIDGLIGGYTTSGGIYTQEWASSGGGAGTTLTLTWAYPISVAEVVLYDRPNLNDQVMSGTLTFSNGTVYPVGQLPNAGTAYSVLVNPAVTTTAILFTVTSVSTTTGSVGLSEIQVYAPLSWVNNATIVANVTLASNTTLASNSTLLTNTTSVSNTTSSANMTSIALSTVDIAMNATATASSYSAGQPPSAAIDGLIGGYTTSGGIYTQEWASSGGGAGTTLTLTWAYPISVAEVVLYDRPNLNDQVTSGTLTFSDGTVYPVGVLPNAGTASPILITPAVTTTTLLFTVGSVSSTTGNVGLSEIQVFTPLSWVASNTTLASNATLASNTTLASNATLVSNTTIITNSANTTVLVDLALSSVATASSYASGQPPSAAIDGLLGGYTTSGGIASQEWASANGGIGTTLTLTWSSPVTVGQVVLYDRPNLNDQVWAGTLTFSDGTVYQVPTLINNGSAVPILISPGLITSTLLFTVTDVSSSTSSVGLSEIQVYAPLAGAVISNTTTSSSNSTSVALSTVDLALSSTATASSYSPGQGPAAAIDGLIGGYTTNGGIYTQEWASAGGGAGTTLTLTWTSEIEVAEVVLFDRPNLDDQVTSGTLTFDDGTVYQVGTLPNAGTAFPVLISPPLNTSTLLFTVTGVSSTTTNVGLSEIEVFAPLSWVATVSNTTVASNTTSVALSTTDLALSSTATASSSSPGQGPGAAIDGLIGGYTTNGGIYTQEWASAGGGAGTTLTLTWASEIEVAEVVLFDRPNLDDQVTSGTLTFDDGTVYQVGTLPNAGTAFPVLISPPLNTSTLLFTVTGVSSTTTNVGLSEIEVFAPLSWVAAVSNTTAASNTTSVALSTTDLALSSTATASSSSPGQGPGAAIDGLIGGYTTNGGIYTQEWASAGGGAGTTLTLTWTSEIEVAEVVLFDRPNLDDQVTSGTLTFDDGSVYQVGTLPNAGTTGLSILISPPINTSTLLFTVTGVSSTTSNVGLSEIEVFAPAVVASSSSSSVLSSTIGSGALSSSATLSSYSSSAPAVTSLNSSTAYPIYSGGYVPAGSAVSTAMPSTTPNATVSASASSGAYAGSSSAVVATGSTAGYLPSASAVPTAQVNSTLTASSAGGASYTLSSSGSLLGSETSSSGNSTPTPTDNSTTSWYIPVGSALPTAVANASVVYNSSATFSSLQASSSSIFASSSAQASASAVGCANSAYSQCGGSTWTSDVCCPSGFTCTVGSVSYSQCLPTTTSSAACSNGANGQCGGANWVGDVCCPPGYTCDIDSIWFSSCNLTVVQSSGGLASSTSSVYTPSSSSVVYFGSSSNSAFATTTISSAAQSSTGISVTAYLNSSSALSTATPSAALSSSSSSLGASSYSGSSPSSTASTSSPGSSSSLTASSTSSQATASSTTLSSSIPITSSAAASSSSSSVLSSSSLASLSSVAASSMSSQVSSNTLSSSSTVSSYSIPVTSSASSASSSPLSSSSVAASSSSSQVSSSSLPTSSFSSTSLPPSSSPSSSSVIPSSSSSSALSSSSIVLSSSAPTSSKASSSSLSSSSAPTTSSASSTSSQLSSSPSSSSVATSSSSKASSSALSSSSSTVSSSSSSKASSSSSSSSSSVASSSSSKASSTSSSSTATSPSSKASSSSASSSKASSTTSSSTSSTKTSSSSSPSKASSTTVSSFSTTTSSTSSSSTGYPTASAQASTVDIARLATATASSSTASSPASGAIDGNIGGVNAAGVGTASQEWVTNGGGAASWIQLNFTSSYLMKEVIFYGSVNTKNQVVSGTLRFDDGTSVAVGTILPAGSTVSLGTAGTTASSLRFTINSVSATTTSIGLAEIQIYNSAPATGTTLIGTA